MKASAEEKAAVFANICRVNTLYMIARAGSGHIGSSFSSLDLVSWIFLNELGKDDLYFSSKGHDVPGLYSVLLATERLPFEKIHELRRLNGLPGHPDVATPYMVTNTGPLGMGISKAKGFSFAKRLQKQKGQIFVLTGDGELQEGQFWESLSSAANGSLGEITVIVDHNKIQSDTWVKNVSDLGELEKKFAAFGWHVERIDGHHLTQISSTLKKLKQITDQPKIIIADTLKGRGVSFMEQLSDSETFYKFHSGAPDQATYEKAATELENKINDQLTSLHAEKIKTVSSERPARLVSDKAHKLVSAYSKVLMAQAEKNQKIVALDADLVLDTGLIPFQEKFPERFRECGIAEQDMVSQAGAMALSGLLPVVHSFACFLSTRPNEQIYNNATEKSKVVYVGSLAGLLPSGPGHSHQSVRDISALGGMPGLTLIEPCHEQEVGLALDYCLNGTLESSYLRLVSIPCDVPYNLPASYSLKLGQGIKLREGSDAVIIGYGPVLLPEAFKAAQQLEAEGFSVGVINLPWLNRIDDAWLKEVVTGLQAVYTLDNHYVRGGQGEFIASRFVHLKLSRLPRVVHFGVEEIPMCGQNAEVLKAHRLDAESLKNRISESLDLAEKS